MCLAWNRFILIPNPFVHSFSGITNHLLGVLVTALPCRLQNDSPPESIVEPHLNKENDSPKIPNNVVDSHQRINENNNLIKTPKLPLDLENAIDESNYVNLNDITKCKAISNDFARNTPKSTDVIMNGMDKPIDNKNGKLNNFYIQINSTSTISKHNPSKPIMSIVNQKNLNNLSNGGGNIANSSLTNNINNNTSNTTNGHTNGFITNTNHLNNNFNGSNNSNTNGNCNGVLNDCSVDTKSIITNGVDHNKNGLPAVSTAHIQYDVASGHQMQCNNNKTGSSNATPQTYVIHNGNGLLTNGNNGIKEMPKADSNKGKY